MRYFLIGCLKMINRSLFTKGGDQKYHRRVGTGKRPLVTGTECLKYVEERGIVKGEVTILYNEKVS